jgi:hypothetical protein
MKVRFLIILFIFGLWGSLKAQNRNGITGYGGLEYFGTLSKFSNDSYLGAKGGIIANDNLFFGTYVRALLNPYFYDAVPALTNPNPVIAENPYSNNAGAITTTINNVEIGLNAGLNIAPAKVVQGTFNFGLGYSFASMSDLVLVNDTMAPLGFQLIEESRRGSGFNLNVMANLQFKVGSAVKIGLPIGYRFSYVSGRTNPELTDKKNVFKHPTMFSGFTYGIELIFGSF